MIAGRWLVSLCYARHALPHSSHALCVVSKASFALQCLPYAHSEPSHGVPRTCRHGHAHRVSLARQRLHQQIQGLREGHVHCTGTGRHHVMAMGVSVPAVTNMAHSSCDTSICVDQCVPVNSRTPPHVHSSDSIYSSMCVRNHILHTWTYALEQKK